MPGLVVRLEEDAAVVAAGCCLDLSVRIQPVLPRRGDNGITSSSTAAREEVCFHIEVGKP